MKSDPLITYRRKPARLDLSQLGKFAETLRARVARGYVFHCVVTGDAELRRLNCEFLGRDYATDVLSFPSGDGDYLGDLAISLVRARVQAREHGHDLETEVRILMLHGVLHLLGMDHEADSGEMARAEKKWRKTFGLPNGLIERAASSAKAVTRTAVLRASSDSKAVTRTAVLSDGVSA